MKAEISDCKELVARLRGEKLNCECHARSCWECCCDTHWPESYCKEAAEAIERLSADNERLERIRQKLIKDRFALSAEAAAHLEAFGIDGADDSYTVFELLINKCAKLIEELAALKSASAEPVAITKIGTEPHNYGLLDVEFLQLVPQGTNLYNHPAPAAVQEDWQLVPKEPTKWMLDAVLPQDGYTTDQRECLAHEYKAMLAAAPKPPVQEDAKDASRYRWLRNQHGELMPIAAVVWKKGSIPSSALWCNLINASDLDKHIDQAMESPHAKP